MILLYCDDIAVRQTVHDYFKRNGILLDAVPLCEFSIRTYAAETEALLIVGDTPPGMLSSLNPQVPVFCVAKYRLGNSFHFREYTDPELLQMLGVYSSSEQYFSYNDVLFGKLGAVLFLGYDLKLSDAERAILGHLVLNSERDVPSEEIYEVCFGDPHGKTGRLANYVSSINRKAINIGGRKMICSPASGFYRIKKYI